MPVSLSQAARLAGKSRNTLVRAIKSGKLSAPKDDNGDYAIDEAELARVFPTTRPSEVDGLEAEVERLGVLLDDMRKERDAWRAQAERLAAAMAKK